MDDPDHRMPVSYFWVVAIVLGLSLYCIIATLILSLFNQMGHYRRHKDKSELDCEFKFPVDKTGRYIRVYVWGNKQALWKNVDPMDDPNWKETFPACCLCFSKESKLQAEIHLVKDKFGVGVVAHELTHFFLYWIHEFDISDDEEACLAMGNWNLLFWNRFYLVGGSDDQG